MQWVIARTDKCKRERERNRENLVEGLGLGVLNDDIFGLCIYLLR